MIEENGEQPGYQRFHPFSEDEYRDLLDEKGKVTGRELVRKADMDVSCEIKELSVSEGLTLSGLFIDGKIQGDIYGETMQGHFTKFVRNIEGIKIGGVLIKKPSDLLDPSVKRSKDLHDFYTTVMHQFFEMSSLKADEVKNSNSSPAESTEEEDAAVSTT